MSGTQSHVNEGGVFAWLRYAFYPIARCLQAVGVCQPDNDREQYPRPRQSVPSAAPPAARSPAHVSFENAPPRLNQRFDAGSAARGEQPTSSNSESTKAEPWQAKHDVSPRSHQPRPKEATTAASGIKAEDAAGSVIKGKSGNSAAPSQPKDDRSTNAVSERLGHAAANAAKGTKSPAVAIPTLDLSQQAAGSGTTSQKAARDRQAGSSPRDPQQKKQKTSGHDSSLANVLPLGAEAATSCAKESAPPNNREDGVQEDPAAVKAFPGPSAAPSTIEKPQGSTAKEGSQSADDSSHAAEAASPAMATELSDTSDTSATSKGSNVAQADAPEASTQPTTAADSGTASLETPEAYAQAHKAPSHDSRKRTIAETSVTVTVSEEAGIVRLNLQEASPPAREASATPKEPADLDTSEAADKRQGRSSPRADAEVPLRSATGTSVMESAEKPSDKSQAPCAPNSDAGPAGPTKALPANKTASEVSAAKAPQADPPAQTASLSKQAVNDTVPAADSSDTETTPPADDQAPSDAPDSKPATEAANGTRKMQAKAAAPKKPEAASAAATEVPSTNRTASEDMGKDASDGSAAKDGKLSSQISANSNESQSSDESDTQQTPTGEAPTANAAKANAARDADKSVKWQLPPAHEAQANYNDKGCATRPAESPSNAAEESFTKQASRNASTSTTLAQSTKITAPKESVSDIPEADSTTQQAPSNAAANGDASQAVSESDKCQTLREGTRAQEDSLDQKAYTDAVLSDTSDRSPTPSTAKAASATVDPAPAAGDAAIDTTNTDTANVAPQAAQTVSDEKPAAPNAAAGKASDAHDMPQSASDKGRNLSDTGKAAVEGGDEGSTDSDLARERKRLKNKRHRANKRRSKQALADI